MILTSTLNALSDFAGLAVAISLAYAGLPNFRYRSRVQEHIRNALKHESGLTDLLNTKATLSSICGHDCWAVLFRLGGLREWEVTVPQPTSGRDNTAPDHNFTKRPDYKSFSWLYSSNLDKVISIALGAISGAAIWLCALDEILFIGANKNGPYERVDFLTGSIAFFFTAIFSVLVLSLVHRLVWKPDRRPKNDRNIGVKAIYWAWSALFVISVLLTSFNSMFFTPWVHVVVGERYIAVAFIVICSSIFLTIGVPLLLLLRGESLTQLMISEADRCISKIKEEIKSAPGSAAIEDEKPVPGNFADIG